MTSKRILYLEPFSGISGDMMLGALLDLGFDFELLKEKLQQLPLEGYHLSSSRVMRAGIRATKLDVGLHEGEDHGHHHDGHHHSHAHPHRSFRDIRILIQSSGLSEWVKEKSLEAFRRLAEAEGKIHAQPADEVHFHEVGAVDSIVDIVGSMIALESFLPVKILSAPVNVGHGTLECRHGLYPVPGPAAQELLKGIPTYSDAIPGELTTPTGAALLATLIEGCGPRPMMEIHSSGYGAGARDFPSSANVLRITEGEQIEASDQVSPEQQVAVLEAAVDDMAPELYGYFQEKALAAGALDVYASPVTMKKNRPGLLLAVVCAIRQIDEMSRLIFSETTTIGLRYTLAARKTLHREIRKVQTSFGTVSVKVSFLQGRRINFAPEYEDCRRLAEQKGVPLKEVMAEAAGAFLHSEGAD
jgi:pyridinium-3,5-bisthiocarboxylic acid mononucleotide nickel chelatase